MPNRVGQQLGYYRLLRLLGSGAFAEVYLGEHIHLKKQAAVKVLRTQLSKDEAENFRREAQTLARLENPHIILMEYAPNGTLRQLHPSKTTVPLPTILAYVKQIAEALYYAHTNHVIHRDVKPENMLLGRQQELLLSDFGIATVTQSTQASNPHSIAGTAVYMAPEQINGKPRPASDQYALAVIVYEWLVGAPPFQGSFIEISTQHLMTSPPHPRSRIPTIPVLVERVVLTALSKEPESRFGNISAFANAMENAYLATQHPTPKPMPRPARPA
ncbi:MAG: serine/threonine protein kinase, partial [Chloroflexi bacterium]